MNRPRYTDALGERLLATVRDAYADADPAPPSLAERSGSALDLRALTIRQPWLDAIITDDTDPKRTENRTTRTHRRGLVLLHAGKSYDRHAADQPVLRRWMMRTGAFRFESQLGSILGLAQITDCHEAAGCCAPWGEPGPGVFHYTLDRVRRLPEPVPCKGALGFWRPPQDVLDAAAGQLAGAS